MTQPNVPSSSPTPAEQVILLARGHMVAHLVYLAAELDLADLIADGAKTAEDLAGPTRTQAAPLYRFLRGLASLGLLTETADGRFRLAPMGTALRRGAPGAARSTVLTIASEWWVRGYGEFRHSLETGRSGFEKALGMPIFEWLARDPERASLFSQTMIGVHGSEPAAIAAAYDFSTAGTILETHRGPRGVLFDLPHVVRDAPALITARGLADRITIRPGSFFEIVPEGGDVYILSHIIHDWGEDQCLRILGNCRRAMRADSRLLVVEMVIPGPDTPHPGKMLDLMMLVGPGGQERTEEEYGDLFEKAGLRLSRVVPTVSPASVIEATAG